MTTSAAPTEAPAGDFRSTMRHVAAAVAVVTRLREGTPIGATVSAFGSLSMAPPLLTVALARPSSLLVGLGPGDPLGVNVLAADHAAVARRFAARVEDRFAGTAWRLAGGVPRLERLHAWVLVRVERLLPAGDHVIVVGEVTEAEPGPGRPLVYHDRTFGTHLAV